MIVLDTNVISEAMKPEPADAVRQWLDAQLADTLYLTAITQAEILFGIARLPSERTKERLSSLFTGIERLFTGRIVPFDSAAAYHYAQIAASAQSEGRGLATADGYIAAIASAHGSAVATRDLRPFLAGGLRVMNPWEVKQ